MLAIPKRFPIVKASGLGLGVFAIGFVGSLALLIHFHPGSSDGSGTNVATHQPSASKTTDKKKAVASAESGSSTKAASHSAVTPTLTSGNGTAAQPVVKYTPPTSTKSTAPVATTGGSGGSPALNVTTAPSPKEPLQVAPQPSSPAPSPAPSTGSTSPLQPVTNLTAPVVNKANNLLGN